MSKTKTLIDAEAWLEQCNPSWMYTDLAKKIIAAAPRVEVPCWVDAAEELPTEPDEYIVMIVGAEKPTVLYFDVDDEKNGVWFEEIEDSTNFYKVTHWRELPDAPQKEARGVEGTFASAASGRESEQKGVAAVAECEGAEATDARCGNGNRIVAPYKEGKKPNVCKCRSCGAEIVWVTMQSGKKMPCDAGTGHYRADPKGSATFVTENGLTMRGEPNFDGETVGYVSHFETCPQADRFRKRGVTV